MVCPNEPIGPDGGGSFEALTVPDPGGCWPPVPVGGGAAPPADGCREMGWTSAAKASSGVGILSTSVDFGCGATVLT